MRVFRRWNRRPRPQKVVMKTVARRIGRLEERLGYGSRSSKKGYESL
jgi:hypothetical protein